MSGSQFDDLTAYLQANMPPRALQFFDAQMDSGQLMRTTKSLGEGRYRVAILRYEAVFSWVGFPFREYPPVMAYALIMAWLNEHQSQLAEELDLAPPRVDPTFDHERAADLYITVELADEITVMENPKGEILFRGKRWSPELPVIYTAEEAEISVSVDHRDG